MSGLVATVASMLGLSVEKVVPVVDAVLLASASRRDRRVLPSEVARMAPRSEELVTPVLTALLLAGVLRAKFRARHLPCGDLLSIEQEDEQLAVLEALENAAGGGCPTCFRPVLGTEQLEIEVVLYGRGSP